MWAFQFLEDVEGSESYANYPFTSGVKMIIET